MSGVIEPLRSPKGGSSHDGYFYEDGKWYRLFACRDIYTEGDLVLQILDDEKNRRVDTTVSSAILQVASPVWKRMTDKTSRLCSVVEKGFQFPNGIKKDLLKLEGDNASALMVVLYAIHHRVDDLPSSALNFNQLLQLAIVCDKYDCAAAILWPMKATWMSYSSKWIPPTGGEYWFFIAETFGIQGQIEELGDKLIEGVEVNSDGDWIQKGELVKMDYIPQRYIDAIEQSRLLYLKFFSSRINPLYRFLESAKPDMDETTSVFKEIVRRRYPDTLQRYLQSPDKYASCRHNALIAMEEHFHHHKIWNFASDGKIKPDKCCASVNSFRLALRTFSLPHVHKDCPVVAAKEKFVAEQATRFSGAAFPGLSAIASKLIARSKQDSYTQVESDLCLFGLMTSMKYTAKDAGYKIPGPEPMPYRSKLQMERTITQQIPWEEIGEEPKVPSPGRRTWYPTDDMEWW